MATKKATEEKKTTAKKAATKAKATAAKKTTAKKTTAKKPAAKKAGPKKANAKKEAAAKKAPAKKAPAKKAAPKKTAAKKTVKKTTAAKPAATKSRVKEFTKKEVEGARWYVIQTQTNYEKRVQSHVREQAMLQKLDQFLGDVVIPVEQVVEVKKGVKSQSERKFFPGYVLLNAAMTDEVWHMIKNIPHVTGFVGAERGRKPLPISNAEAGRILKQMEEGVERPRNMISFDIGEEVRVTEGPFSSFQGVVEEVDEEKSRLKVSVSIFGRATPIELDFTQVEKG